MKGAFSKDEALRWAFCVKTAFLAFDYNPEIDSEMNDILSSKEVPFIVAVHEERSDKDLGMPSVLVNLIFKTTFNQEQLKMLWCWIKEYSIDKISYPYQYLSLLLFLENHHSLLLGNRQISNTDMENQMKAWYPTSKVKCSADSLGTYRNGFFKKDNFRYASWLRSNGEPPLDYEYKRDQALSGFKALNKCCNDLELNLSELKI
jgi:hypothetical protein